MTRRENTNNLGQCFVLDIRHTIYGSIIGMSLCGFSHNKLKNYVFFFQLCVSVKCDIYYHTSTGARGTDHPLFLTFCLQIYFQ